MPAKIVDRKEKKCSRCANLLPMSEFTVTASRPSGSSRCKVCQSEVMKQRWIDNPEQVSAAAARWKARHPEQYAALMKVSKAAYYQANSEDLKVKVREWQAANPEKVKVFKKLNAHKRRAKTKGNHVPAWVVERLFALFGGMCAYCRTAPAAHIDHIYPLSKNGEHLAANLAPACASCNLSKNASLPEEFQARTGYDVLGVIDKVKDLGKN